MVFISVCHLHKHKFRPVVVEMHRYLKDPASTIYSGRRRTLFSTAENKCGGKVCAMHRCPTRWIVKNMLMSGFANRRERRWCWDKSVYQCHL